MDFIIPNKLSGASYSVQHMTHKPSISRIDVVEGLPQGFVGNINTESIMARQQKGIITHATTIKNYTDDIIVVVDKNNCITVIPPVSADDKAYQKVDDCIVIEMVKSKSLGSSTDESIFNIYRQMLLKGSDRVRDKFYTVNQEQMNEQLNEYFTITCNNFPDLDESCQTAFYLEEANIVISKYESRDVYLHPDTSEKELMTLMPGEDIGTLAVKIKINDPDHTYARAFVNIGNSPHPCPISRTGVEEAGITISTSKQNRGRVSKTNVKTYTLDDPTCPIKIFKSIDEAACHGNVAAKLAHDTNMAKLQTQKVKVDAEEADVREMLAKTQRESELQAKTHEFELRQQQQAAHLAMMQAENKQQMEKLAAERAAFEASRKREQAKAEEKARERSEKINRMDYFRKLLIEGVKLVTTVITSAVAVIAWYKLKKP